MCKQSPFFMFSGLIFSILFKNAAFEKPENLVTHTVIHIRQLSFLTHLQQFLPPFFYGFS